MFAEQVSLKTGVEQDLKLQHMIQTKNLCNYYESYEVFSQLSFMRFLSVYLLFKEMSVYIFWFTTN